MIRAVVDHSKIRVYKLNLYMYDVWSDVIKGTNNYLCDMVFNQRSAVSF